MLCKQCGKSNIEPPILEGLLNTPFLVKGLLNVTVSGLFPFGAFDNFDPVTNDVKHYEKHGGTGDVEYSHPGKVEDEEIYNYYCIYIYYSI